MTFKLAIDMGSTSLGWCILDLDQDMLPTSIKDMGVRIFSDGRDDKTKEPLAVARRNARTMRRQLDRRHDRKADVMKALVKHGLMPADKKARKTLERLDPYELRARAASERVELHELGRALFHICRRRGFKSNRKTDARENDLSNMKTAMRDLESRMGKQTLGQYLHSLNDGKNNPDKQPVRVKTHKEKNKNVYNLYATRKMYEDEVNAIFAEQQKHHSVLSDDICNEIKDIIFYQRLLQPQTVGLCRFESHNHERRARKAYPIVQRFRILQEVNNLALVQYDRNTPTQISTEQKHKIIELLSHNKKCTFGELRTALKLPSDSKFNLESDKRKDLRGDDTSAQMSDEKAFGPGWHDMPVTDQNSIIDLLFETENQSTLITRLETDWGRTAEQAHHIADLRLQDGHGHVSVKAITKMLPHLEKGMVYSDAAQEAGYHHSDFRTGEIFEHLPYYGAVLQDAVIGGSNAPEDKNKPEKYYGKINNPSVHIALNQLRKLVNAIIDTYGRPAQIAIELARDLKEPADEINKQQAQNKRDNDRINKELEKLGQRPNYANRMIFKLWEDLAKDPEKRCCPFTGKQISAHQIFSGEFEVEHLLPFSQSYNDGRANKVLACREANRRKGGQTPFDAFGHTAEWNAIIARAENLPSGKRWRFQPNAMEIARGKGEDMIARMLNDTRYMSRVAAKYLSFLYPEHGPGSNHIITIPGQMTALLRKKWGLNNLLNDDGVDIKNRTDHRHHAIDAFVVGCSTRGMFKQLSAAARKMETDAKLWAKRYKLVADMPAPIPDMHTQLQTHLDRLVVSHKPDHGNAYKAIRAKQPYTIASLHNQTAYSLAGPAEKKGLMRYVTRKPITSLTKTKDIESIVDPTLRAQIHSALAGCKENSAQWKEKLVDFVQNGRKETIRRVRVYVEKKPTSMVGVYHAEDRDNPDATPYKYYERGGNYCAEIFCPDKGKKAGIWQCEIISNYDAHQKDFLPAWRRENATAKLIMRLHIDDMVAYEEDGQTIICRVKKLTNGLVYLRSHTISKENADKLSWGASAKQLQLKNARKVSVDILGRVKDPKAKHAQKAAAG